MTRKDTIQLLSSAAGLGLVGGVRLYAAALVVGLAIRVNLFHPAPELSELRVLGDTRILAAARGLPRSRRRWWGLLNRW